MRIHSLLLNEGTINSGDEIIPRVQGSGALEWTDDGTIKGPVFAAEFLAYSDVGTLTVESVYSDSDLLGWQDTGTITSTVRADGLLGWTDSWFLGQPQIQPAPLNEALSWIDDGWILFTPGQATVFGSGFSGIAGQGTLILDEESGPWPVPPVPIPPPDPGETPPNWVSHLGSFAINRETGAASRYHPFEFNSVAGDLVLGPNALYRLAAGDSGEGDESVSAYITMPWTDFGLNDPDKPQNSVGGAELKRMPKVGISGRGELLLKLRLIADDGKVEEHWYPFSAHTADLIRERQAQPGQGLVSSTYQIEIANRGGSDFLLERLDTYLDIQRRVL